MRTELRKRVVDGGGTIGYMRGMTPFGSIVRSGLVDVMETSGSSTLRRLAYWLRVRAVREIVRNDEDGRS